ncbi:thioredoxin-disulfide reductase [Ethanoligenens sp.]|uniref:thioredoxin-disulfide reductase n=1 Tax=Ethanoligenens sp. TaxID=2099655 RepID=UPI0039ED8E00
MVDVLIVGGGPAGVTAAIYAARAGLSTMILERMGVGGQAATTFEIENWPGSTLITGFDFSTNLEKHAKSVGAEMVYGDVTAFSLEGAVKKVTTAKETYEAKAVILALGAERRLLGAPGEKELTGRGVSYCATCDGNFFRKKTVAVIGGGNSAVEDAIYLANICEKVYIIHRRDQFRAEGYLQRKLEGLSNVEKIFNTGVERIEGETAVTGLVLKEKSDGAERVLPASGIFIAVGTKPRTDLLAGALPLDKGGYVDVDENCATPLPGVFVAGDIRKKALRQIVTAASDGANAANAAIHFLA